MMMMMMMMILHQMRHGRQDNHPNNRWRGSTAHFCGVSFISIAAISSAAINISISIRYQKLTLSFNFFAQQNRSERALCDGQSHGVALLPKLDAQLVLKYNS
jgi:hypothetical protein